LATVPIDPWFIIRLKRKENPMGEFTDKIKAAANKTAGAVKQAVGEHNNDAELTAEGKAQKAKGTGQDIKGSIKGALGDKI
jgi:uncharacterized protein YjbJ (UPF0337 family)